MLNRPLALEPPPPLDPAPYTRPSLGSTSTHPAPGSTLRWELEAADTGCTLRLSHIVPDVEEAIDNCYLVGLQASLARLEPSLAGRPEPWDWDAFAIAQAHYAGLGLAAPVEAS